MHAGNNVDVPRSSFLIWLLVTVVVALIESVRWSYYCTVYSYHSFLCCTPYIKSDIYQNNIPMMKERNTVVCFSPFNSIHGNISKCMHAMPHLVVRLLSLLIAIFVSCVHPCTHHILNTTFVVENVIYIYVVAPSGRTEWGGMPLWSCVAPFLQAVGFQRRSPESKWPSPTEGDLVYIVPAPG
jgi:hypothetical protein